MLATRLTTSLAGLLLSSSFLVGCGSSVDDQQTSGGASSSGSGGSAGGGPVSSGPAVLFEVGDTGLNPWDLAVDADNVYVTDARGPDIGVVLAIPLDGSHANVLASGLNSPDGITVFGSDLFAMSSAGLLKIPTKGGPAVVLDPGSSAGSSTLVFNDKHVYWTSYTSPGQVARIAPDGSDLLVYPSMDSYPSGIAVGGGNVYWASFGAYNIQSAPVAGGSSSVFVADSGTVRKAVVADDSFLYYVNESPGGGDGSWVMKVPLAGGAPVELAHLKEPHAWMGTELVVDGANLYFNAIGADFDDCPIVRVPIAGGAPEIMPVPKELGCAGALAQDAANLYFVHTEGVSRLPK